MSSRAGVAAFDRFARRLIRRGAVPGLIFSAARAGRPTLTRSYGHSDAEDRVAPTPATVHGVASVTKSFTCVAILQLAEEGRLSVQDPVARHLPDFGLPDSRATRRIRLHHLMTHTSGLPPLPAIYYEMARSLRLDESFDARACRRVGIDVDRPPVETYPELLAYLRRERFRLLGPPGEVFSYSNEGFGLLGAVIEVVSGERYERLLEDRIFRPAGMRQTTFDLGVVRRFADVATTFTRVRRVKRFRTVPAPAPWEMSCMRAAGALSTNVEDLLRYLEMYRTGGRIGEARILSARSARAMTTPYVEAEPGKYYGYGLSVAPGYHGATVIGHSGGLKGVSSYVAAIPERGITAAGLSNFDLAPTGAVVHAAMNTLLGLPPAEPLVRYRRRRHAGRPLSAYEGLYGSGEGIWVRVQARRRHLRLDFTGIEILARGIRAYPYDRDAFVVGKRYQPGTVRFVFDGGSRPSSVALGWRVVRRRSEADWDRVARHPLVW